MVNDIITCPENRERFLLLVKNNSNKLVIIKASAQWCKPCKKISNFVNSCFDKLPGNKLLILLDIDDSDDVASFLKIKSLPTLLAYTNGAPTHVLMSSKPDDVNKFFVKCGMSEKLNLNVDF